MFRSEIQRGKRACRQVVLIFARKADLSSYLFLFFHLQTIQRRNKGTRLYAIYGFHKQLQRAPYGERMPRLTSHTTTAKPQLEMLSSLTGFLIRRDILNCFFFSWRMTLSYSIGWPRNSFFWAWLARKSELHLWFCQKRWDIPKWLNFLSFCFIFPLGGGRSFIWKLYLRHPIGLKSLECDKEKPPASLFLKRRYTGHLNKTYSPRKATWWVHAHIFFS